jgi:nucleotide-binding universal stress UspA family protein
MRIVCSVGLRAGPELLRRIFAVTAAAQPELVLVRVIDMGPRKDLEQISGPLHFGPRRVDHRRDAAIDAAEEAAGRVSLDEALEEARAAGVPAVARLERGKPEQVIVAVAREVQASLVAIRARDHAEGHPFVGPASVGHVARFVLDHAPCDVLLLRT